MRSHPDPKPESASKTGAFVCRHNIAIASVVFVRCSTVALPGSMVYGWLRDGGFVWFMCGCPVFFAGVLER